MALSKRPGLEGLLQLVTAALITRLRAITLDDRIPAAQDELLWWQSQQGKDSGPTLPFIIYLGASLFYS